MIPEILCISLPDSARRARVGPRFDHHGLRYRFIDAVRPGEPEDVFYRSPGLEKDPHVACFASHLKAIRAFWNGGEPWGLIAEDDLLLRNEFRAEYPRILANVPPACPLVTFFAMVEEWDASPWAGVNPALHNLRAIDPKKLWGAVLYGLTRDYAGRALALYDRPFGELPYVTSEIVIRESGGLLSWPYLAIEEGLQSDRGDQSALAAHHRHCRPWIYANYNATEGDRESPLK